MKSNIRLGRGLDALIKKESIPFDKIPPELSDQLAVNPFAKISVNKVTANRFQPRRDFDQRTLEELKKSIRENGLIQPITVRQTKDGGFELVSGERRLRAMKELGIREIPAYVLQVDSDEKMLEMALTENLQREDLNPIEIALGYERLIDECNLTQEKVADKVGKDRATVANFLRLLKLPAPIQKGLVSGDITAGHARALLSIENSNEQFHLFNKIARDNLSVRQVEREVQRLTGAGKNKKLQSKGSSTNKRANASESVLSDLVDKLRKHLGTQVKINYGENHAGDIRVEFYSDEDLERLIEIILGDRKGK
ncbi:MAG TPA: ParB/RepB/Spo0J family partition protein [Candidatus Acidoferrales bacterium]|nr:ParB/RepB/Spo0J family partition protein [Candidatus Acidoferrales bacterium]